jgi:hypothetical protein
MIRLPHPTRLIKETSGTLSIGKTMEKTSGIIWKEKVLKQLREPISDDERDKKTNE